METPRTFPLIGGPFDGQANEMALAHPPEHLVIAIPAVSPQAGSSPETQVAIYLREQVPDGQGGQTYQYRHSETRGLHPDETRR
jgi:hypothetical protein